MKFRYTATDQNGEWRQGEVDAPDRKRALLAIHATGLNPSRVDPVMDMVPVVPVTTGSSKEHDETPNTTPNNPEAIGKTMSGKIWPTLLVSLLCLVGAWFIKQRVSFPAISSSGNSEWMLWAVMIIITGLVLWLIAKRRLAKAEDMSFSKPPGEKNGEKKPGAIRQALGQFYAPNALGRVLAILAFWIGLFLLVFQFKKDWLEWLTGRWPMVAFTALVIATSVIAGGLAKPQEKKKGTTISGVLLTWFGGATVLYLVFFVALPEDSSRAVRGINTNTAPTSAPARAENWRTKESFTIIAPTNGWVTVKVRYGERLLWKRLEPAPVYRNVDGKMDIVQPYEIAPRASGNQFRFSSATNREVPILVEILVKE